MGRLDLPDPVRDEDVWFESFTEGSARERAAKRNRDARARLAADPYEQIRQARSPWVMQNPNAGASNARYFRAA